MMEQLQDLLDRYIQWLRDKSVLREEDGYIEITTPFLDRHNDYIQIYVKRCEDGFLLTDGGETIEDLRASGVDLDTPKRQSLLSMRLNALGVRREGEELVIRTTAEEFPLHKHNLIQAILAVDDLFYLARSMIKSLFLEDVSMWLHEHEIRFTRDVKFTGASGFDHTIDFIIPSSSAAPERLIRAVSRATRDVAESLAFTWIDIRDLRPHGTRFYVFLNDQEQDLPDSVVDALKSYQLIPVPWSERTRVRRELSA